MDRDTTKPAQLNAEQRLLHQYAESVHTVNRAHRDLTAAQKFLADSHAHRFELWRKILKLRESGELKHGVYRVRAANYDYADGLVISSNDSVADLLPMFR